MFNRNYNIFLIIFLSSFILSCKSAKVEQKQALKTPALQNALLWKIDSNNLKNPSYIFGTIHLIEAKKFFLPDGFNRAFEESENIVFEIDMKIMNDPGEMMKLLPKILMRGDTSIKDLLSEEDYKLVGEHLKKSGLPLFLFEKIKPLFLTMFGEGDINAMSLQNGEYKSYEMEFEKMATKNNKNIGGLETIDYQVGVLDSIPYKEQADMLIKSIKDGNDSISQMDDIIRLYTEQNINALHNSIKSDEMSKYENILLNNRNRNWIPVMSDYMIKNSTMFAVGAGHLGGEDGIIRLLKKEGYRVTPILNNKKRVR